jgi:hypothetical protein
MYSVVRPVRSLQQFPLIRKFVYTGEPMNPYRCECCATKQQRKALGNVKAYGDVQDKPEICRKCAVEFN